MSDLMDNLFYKLRTKTGLCTMGGTEDVADLLEKGEQYSGRAATMLSFTNIDPGAAKRLQEASEKLGKLKQAVGRYNSLCQDLKEVEKMSKAMDVLNTWASGQMDRNDPRAAVAFGELFESAGHFAGKLPVPFNAYARLLAGCGHFFLDMQRLLDPDNRSIGGGMKLRDLKYDGS